MVIYLAAKEREKAQKLAQQKKLAEASSRLTATPPSSKKASGAGTKKSGTATPVRTLDSREIDISGLNLRATGDGGPPIDDPPPKIAIAREKLLEEIKKTLDIKDEKKAISLVVIGELFAVDHPILLTEAF